MRQFLLFFLGNTHVIPEVNFALFHFNQVAKIGEKLVDIIPVEQLGFTSVKIKNEFKTIYLVFSGTITLICNTLINSIWCYMSYRTTRYSIHLRLHGTTHTLKHSFKSHT